MVSAMSLLAMNNLPWLAHPVQIAPQTGKGRVATVGQFHFQQIRELDPGLKFRRHVVVENPYATLGFDLPQRFKLRR